MESYEEETENQTNEQKKTDITLTFNQIIILTCLLGFFLILAIIVTQREGRRR
jgi:hypothetical protein